MKGQTKGVVVANKLKEVFDDFNFMGRLFAMVFDGGLTCRQPGANYNDYTVWNFATLHLNQKFVQLVWLP